MIQRIARRIREMIGITRHVMRTITSRLRRSSFAPTKDWGRPDYAFWDKARRGKAQGLEISGLFLKPLASKVAAWTLGRRPGWKTEDIASQQALNNWWTANHTDILRGWREALALGDHFVVINSDLTPTIVTPDVVDPLVADDDYSKIVGWRITEVYEHPERAADRMRITDEYTPTERVRTIDINGTMVREERYPNLIGLVPVIHIPNLGGSDEVFGRPEGEALLTALHRYGELFDAGMDGNIRQGRSTPTINFQTKQDLDAFWDRYSRTETQEMPDGTTESTEVVDFDADQLLTVSAADFNWKSPQSFSQDTERFLGLLFYLLLQHTEVPEFIWGNAISSSKASADAQMPPFIRYIEMRQGEISKWLLQIAEVVLGYLALTEPGVRAQKPSLQWEPLADSDQQLTQDTVQWAYTEGLLDRKTALLLAPALDIDDEDIDDILKKADEEAAERAPELTEPTPVQTDDAFQQEIERLESGGD